MDGVLSNLLILMTLPMTRPDPRRVPETGRDVYCFLMTCAIRRCSGINIHSMLLPQIGHLVYSPSLMSCVTMTLLPSFMDISMLKPTDSLCWMFLPFT